MSKARDICKALALAESAHTAAKSDAHQVFCPSTGGVVAKLEVDYGVTPRLSLPQARTLDASDALALAAWIVELFGEESPDAR